MQERLKPLLLPVAALALVEIWARAVHLQSDSLAPPSAIVRALFDCIADGSLLTATRDTLFPAFAGLLIGGSIGLAFGLALGIFRIFDRLMEVTIEAIRPIPSIALLPIALIALGFGYRMEIVIVAFSCVWPVLILSRAAVAGIEPRLIEVSRALRLSPADRVRKIIIPAALPRIFLAFRLAAGIALIVAVTVEIAINPNGLGAAIMTAQQALRPDLMLGYLLWIGLVGYALNAGLGCRAAASVRDARRWCENPHDARSFQSAIALARRQLSRCRQLCRHLANGGKLAARVTGVPARTGSCMGVAGEGIYRWRSLAKAGGHGFAHGLWLVRRVGRRHRARRLDRLVADFAQLSGADAGVSSAAAGVRDHSGRDCDVWIDRGHGAVRDCVWRDLADAAGDDPRFCGGRVPALRGCAIAAHVAAWRSSSKSRCRRPAPIFWRACD